MIRNILGHDDVDVIHGGIDMARRRPVVLDSGRLCRADFAFTGKVFDFDGLKSGLPDVASPSLADR